MIAGLAAGDRPSLESSLEAVTRQKDEAYRERNALVAALAKLWPAHLCRHPESDVAWDADWRWIVCVHSPAGQVTWHIHDSERDAFNHLAVSDAHWDGHTTEEKYRRLASVVAGDRPALSAPEVETAWLLIETWKRGKAEKTRHEGIALTHEDAAQFVHADFDMGYSRSSEPLKIYRRAGPVAARAQPQPACPRCQSMHGLAVPASATRPWCCLECGWEGKPHEEPEYWLKVVAPVPQASLSAARVQVHEESLANSRGRAENIRVSEAAASALVQDASGLPAILAPMRHEIEDRRTYSWLESLAADRLQACLDQAEADVVRLVTDLQRLKAANL